MTRAPLPPEFDYPKDWPRCACGRPVLDGHLTCGQLECNEAVARELARTTEPDVFGGQFYLHGPGVPFVPIGEMAPRQPDAWICRRVVDYPAQRVPAGGEVTPCARCAAPVVYNPKREGITAPKVCMQCSGIIPCPIES